MSVVLEDLKSDVYYFKLRACTNAGAGLTSHVIMIDTLDCSSCPKCEDSESCSGEGDNNHYFLNQLITVKFAGCPACSAKNETQPTIQKKALSLQKNGKLTIPRNRLLRSVAFTAYAANC